MSLAAIVSQLNYPAIAHRNAYFHSYTLEFREFAKLRSSKDIPIKANPISVKNSVHLDTNDNLLGSDVTARESKIRLIRK